MEEIRDGVEIEKNDVVGIIYEVDGIYYIVIGLGGKPRHDGNEVKAFKGGNEVEPEVKKIEEDLNKGSSVYQKKREKLKKENRSYLKKVRKSLTSERERRQIKKMGLEDYERVFDFFS